MRIKFVQRHVVQQGDGKGPVYEAGKEYEIADETYARKYIRRGWAEEGAPAPVKPMIVPTPFQWVDPKDIPRRAAMSDAPLEAVMPLTRDEDGRLGVADAGAASSINLATDRRVIHAGRGRWNVIDADGNKLNETPLSREEADALAAEPAKE